MSVNATKNSDGLASLRIDHDSQEERQGSRPKWKWILTLALVLFVLFLARWAYRSFLEPLNLPRVRTTTAVSLAPDQSQAVLTATGYIVAQRQSAVTSKITGRLAELNVVEGTAVRRGQVIGRLEDEEFRAALEESRSGLEVTKAAYAESMAREVEARREYARQERLLAEKVTSQADFDGAEARHKVAIAQMDSAAAAIPQAEATVRVSEVALSNTKILAPFDGVVTTKNAEVGEIVAPVSAGGPASGNSVVLIADMQSLEAEIDINESNIARIRVGQPAEIMIDAFPDRKFRGRLRQIVPTANRQKATIQGKVEFIDGSAGVLPEMSARVTFLEDARPDEAPATTRVFVPRETLLSRGGSMAVFTIRDNHIIEVPVRIGPEVEGRIEILSGLEGGERLVINPSAEMESGTKVRIGENGEAGSP
jgi:RND family efflux transporter MFP subunit